MAVNKVEINGKTIIDLTKDTVLPQTLLSGVTAHNAAGDPIVGAVAVAPASATLPKASGEAAVGEENTFARGDHVHPKEVSDAERAAWSAKPGMVVTEIPKGRMRGDIKGTGKVGTVDDLTSSQYYSKATDPANPDSWACDVNGDGGINSGDAFAITSGKLYSTPFLADYYNNWTYHKMNDTSGYWTTELSIPAITTEMGASIVCGGSVRTGTFIKAEPFAGGIRIYANYPPIEALPCEISYATGVGGRIIIANTGVSDTYVQDAVSSVGAKYVRVRLTAAGWGGGKEQIVSVPGLKGSAAEQLIIPTQPSSSIEKYYNAGVRISARSDEELTFSCETIPTEDITVFLVIIPIIGKI